MTDAVRGEKLKAQVTKPALARPRAEPRGPAFFHDRTQRELQHRISFVYIKSQYWKKKQNH